MVVAAIGALLSGLYLAVFSTQLPVHAHLFRIRPSGFAQIRAVQRALAHGEKALPLSSLGRQRLRPRAINLLCYDFGIDSQL